jgi:hypothetical protein
MIDATAKPPLSIVVAGVNVRETLRPWLEAVAPQRADPGVEVLLAVTADDADFTRQVSSQFTLSDVVMLPSGALVPALWGAAIVRATGEIVAVTITACTPASDWIAAIIAAHTTAYVGIGGVIDIAPDANVVDRALHIVRYTPYLPPLAAAPVEEIAGDNGTYKRRAFDGVTARLERDGFWEAELHRDLRARGETLWIDPRIRVSHARSYSAAGFSAQRFAHGRHFGRARGRSLTAGDAVIRAMLAPVVPTVMIARQVSTLSRRGRLDLQTASALPLAFWFLTCWAWGEAVGLLGG